MADPGTWALVLAGVGTAATVAGAASQASGQIAQGDAARQLADYRAQIARNNATSATADATYATEAGGVEAYNQGIKGRAHLGNVKASQAASGININTGSAVDVRATEAEANAQEQQNIRQNASLKAYGYRRQAADYQAEAGLDERGGYNSQLAARSAAGSTVLGAASSLAFKWGGIAANSAGGGGDSGDSGGSDPYLDSA